MNNNAQTSKKTEQRNVVSGFFLFSLILILFGTTCYFYYQFQKLSRNPLTAQISAQEEAKRVAAMVEKLILLPKSETPTVATVTDVSKLKDQPFFKNAKNGNKVLIYANAKLAILYDPKLNIIVNVGPVNFSEQQTDVANIPSTVRIGLRNGTKVVGVTHSVETVITSTFPNSTITLRDQDKNTNIVNTIVIDLSGKMKALAKEIAASINAQVSTLPNGEFRPSGVDILVIVGKDKN